MYKIEWARSARVDMRGLDRDVARRVRAAVENLAENPRPDGCTKLSGFMDTYRVRVGGYRILYEVKDDVVLVTVIRVGSRGQVYRH